MVEYAQSTGAADCTGVQGGKFINSTNVSLYSIGPNTTGLGVSGVCGVALLGNPSSFGKSAFTGNNAADQVILMSIATQNSNGSLQWTNYSTTKDVFPNLPVLTIPSQSN